MRSDSAEPRYSEPSSEWLAAWAKAGRLLEEAFPSGTAPNPKLYERFLCDIDPDLLGAAVVQIVGTRKFPTFPTVGEIRETAAELVGSRYPTALEGWQEARAFIEATRRGEGREFTWTNPLARRVVELLGVAALTVSDNAVADRAQFRDGYNELVARERSAARLIPEARAALRSVEAKALPAAPESSAPPALGPPQTLECDECKRGFYVRFVGEAPTPYRCRDCQAKEARRSFEVAR